MIEVKMELIELIQVELTCLVYVIVARKSWIDWIEANGIRHSPGSEFTRYFYVVWQTGTNEQIGKMWNLFSEAQHQFFYIDIWFVVITGLYSAGDYPTTMVGWGLDIAGSP